MAADWHWGARWVHFFSAIPSLALNGWIFGLALAGGAYLGTQLLKFLP